MTRRRAGFDSSMAAYSVELTELLMSARQGLPRALNGRPMAPSNDYAAQVLKDIGQERSACIDQLVAITVTNARDGAGDPTILFLRRLIAIIETESRQTSARSLETLIRGQQRAGGVLTSAEFDVVAGGGMHQPIYLERVERAADANIRASEAVLVECERELALIRGGERPTRVAAAVADFPRPHSVRKLPRQRALQVMS